MNDKPVPVLGAHGASTLPSVTVDSFNLELRDADGFIGDRASKSAFMEAVEEWRSRLKKAGGDPLGDADDLGRKKLEKILFEGEPEAAGLVLGAIEEFAQQLAAVIRRFLKAKGWRDTERLAIGGGMRESRIGALAIGRAGVILKAEGIGIELRPIRNHPDEAGLIGALHLAPAWIFTGHDSLLAIDLGGTNVRAGVVLPNMKKGADLAKAGMWKTEHWRHRDDKPSREELLKGIVGMLEGLIAAAGKEGLRLAPFIGIGCPGIVNEDGTIERGAQNLPGNWHSSRFNLPERLRQVIPAIGEHEVAILMHNDAVVQGLSEVPFMQDVERWGVLTIGTGLGNARFTNRTPPSGK